MKKVIFKFAFVVLLLLCSFVAKGCYLKSSISINIIREKSTTIATKSDEDWKNRKSINEVMIEKCFIFDNYNQLIAFLDENDLKIYNEEYMIKYNEDFFEDKSLIIFHNVDPTSGYQYKFDLTRFDKKVTLTIKICDPPMDSAYLEYKVEQLYFLEISKNELIDYDEFDYELVYEKRN